MRKPRFEKDHGEIFMLLLPVVYLVLGILLLFFDSIKPSVLAQLLGAIMILFGAAFIIRYFIRHSYMDTSAYGFSLGAFAIILGVCVIIKSEAVGESLIVCLDICIMLTAIIKLQNAIQLIFMKSKFFIPVLVLSAAFIACTILIAVDVFHDAEVQNKFTYITMICDGVASFVITIVLRSKHRNKLRSEGPGMPPIEA